MGRGRLRLFNVPVLLLATAALLCLSAPARAQSTTAPSRTAQNNAPRSEVAQFDQFLDSHPEIAEQLRKNPALANDREFVRDHPALAAYLQNNPGIRDQLRQDPNAFMRDENRFDRAEDVRGQNVSRRDLADFDRFLDNHREIAEQVRRNPSLVDNREFVDNHTALQTYLRDNPGVREQLRQDPNAFMRDENRFDRAEDVRDQNVSRRDLADFDRFLDNHREIAEQVRRNPSLVDNREFVQNHPALQTYLQTNPSVRDQIRQDPNAFMRQEDRFDAATGRERGVNHDHMASFGEFLGGHAKIAEDVSRNPSLVKDHEYIDNHRELGEYLNAHPEIRTEWEANPAGFVKGSQQFTSGGTSSGSTAPAATSPTHSEVNGSSSSGGTPNPKPKQ